MAKELVLINPRLSNKDISFKKCWVHGPLVLTSMQKRKRREGKGEEYDIFYKISWGATKI